MGMHIGVQGLRAVLELDAGWHPSSISQRFEGPVAVDSSDGTGMEHGDECGILLLSPSLSLFFTLSNRLQAGMSMEEYDKPNIRRLSVTVNDQLPPIPAKK